MGSGGLFYSKNKANQINPVNPAQRIGFEDLRRAGCTHTLSLL